VTSDLHWARSAPAVAARSVLLASVLGPLIGAYTRRRIRGREHLQRIRGPVIFVANHASHVDTPTILRALPRAFRKRTAVAAAADYFYERPALAALVALAFNTVPLERRAGASPAAVSILDRLLDDGWSLVIFAEGTRSRDGSIGRLHSGAAVLAAAHDVPIVPVHVWGTHGVMPPGRRWMRRPALLRRAAVGVTFGPPQRATQSEHRTAVMERVREFFAAEGAVTTPDKRVLAAQRRGAAAAAAPR
jgi:1-acyl-sn-glycerol-3-phosphate acyltransferase